MISSACDALRERMAAMNESPRVAVLGLGYVGCVTATCLAATGHNVCGTDRDEHKVASVRRGEAPFYEPGLAELVKENVAAGRLAASTSTAEAIADADIALLCVGTPSERNGDLVVLHSLAGTAGVPRHRHRGRRHGFDDGHSEVFLPARMLFGGSRPRRRIPIA